MTLPFFDAPRGTTGPGAWRVGLVLLVVLAVGAPLSEARAQSRGVVSADRAMDVGLAVARAARTAWAGHDMALRVIGCSACLVDPELRILLALHTTRGRGFEREADRLWYAELNRIADRATGCDASHTCGAGEVDERLVDALVQMAPGWPRGLHLAQSVAEQRVERAIAAERYDAAVELAHDLLFTHGSSRETLAVVVRARRARMEAALSDPLGSLAARRRSTDQWITAWGDALAVERYTSASMLPSFEAIVDHYFAAFHDGRPLRELEEFARHVEALALQVRTVEAQALQARTHYEIATIYWRREGWMIRPASRARLESHLEQAEGLGWTDDPAGLRSRLEWLSWTPGLLPIGLISLLAGLFWRTSRVRVRLRARRLLRRGARLRAEGAMLEAAVTFEGAWEHASRLASLDRRDQLLMAHAAIPLLYDALERREMTQAAQWADRLSELPFEYWPDGFEGIARRCGIDLSDRLRHAARMP